MRSIAALALLALSRIARAAQGEPPGDLILLGAWVQPDDGDSPSIYNQRTGQNASIFQIAIDIPQVPYNYVTGAGGPPPEYTIEQTNTDAYVFLTVYPTTFSLRDADYATLGAQLKNYTEVYNRTVFLRWAPEMQGIWMPYGNQPTAYLAMWNTMYPTIKSIAPQTIIVWAPNTGQGYPYGQTFTGIINGGTNPNGAADTLLLDTNHDGQFTNLDDPFSPYYPGDNLVDWNALSVYYKGPDNQNLNVPNAPDVCGQAWASFDPGAGTAGPTNFYTTYCANKPSKACLFAEAAAAYHPADGGGSSELVMHQTWWEDCIFNTTFWNSHPRIKGYIHFEYEKVEYDSGVEDLRDYRNTNDTSVLGPYVQALNQFASRVQWANYREAPPSIPSSGRPGYLPGANYSSSSVPQIVFQTQRLLDFSVPTLFGISAAERLQAAVIGATTIAAAALGASSLFIGRAGGMRLAAAAP